MPDEKFKLGHYRRVVGQFRAMVTHWPGRTHLSVLPIRARIRLQNGNRAGNIGRTKRTLHNHKMKSDSLAMHAAAAVGQFLEKDGSFTGTFPTVKVAKIIQNAYQSSAGKIGGKATGSSKARTPEQARAAAQARWAKVKAAKK